MYLLLSFSILLSFSSIGSNIRRQRKNRKNKISFHRVDRYENGRDFPPSIVSLEEILCLTHISIGANQNDTDMTFKGMLKILMTEYRKKHVSQFDERINFH